MIIRRIRRVNYKQKDFLVGISDETMLDIWTTKLSVDSGHLVLL